ncbi:MAG: type III secretion system chaperone [Lentisphaeria bacterium]|nr:type III secretion system chaperone [Lentisphaeria bacterium]
MTSNLEKLAAMAAQIWSPQTVISDEIGFILDLEDTPISFFAKTNMNGVAFCRTAIASLGETKCPDGFAEAALAGNFFWSGTNGATLSYNEAENTFYLTDRFDDNAFEDESAFESYVVDFMRTIMDWRARLSVYLPETDKTAEEVR